MFTRNTNILGASIIWLSFWFYEADTHFLLSVSSEPFDLKNIYWTTFVAMGIPVWVYWIFVFPKIKWSNWILKTTGKIKIPWRFSMNIKPNAIVVLSLSIILLTSVYAWVNRYHYHYINETNIKITIRENIFTMNKCTLKQGFALDKLAKIIKGEASQKYGGTYLPEFCKDKLVFIGNQDKP